MLLPPRLQHCSWKASAFGCALSLENFTDTVEQCVVDGMLGWKMYNCSK